MKIFLAIWAFFCFSVPALAATDQEMLYFVFNISPNDTAKLEKVEIIGGEPSVFPPSSPEGYELSILTNSDTVIYQTPVNVIFPLDNFNALESYRLPLNYLAQKVTLKKGGQLLVEADLPKAICQSPQSDGMCQEFCQGRGLDPDCFQCGNGFCDPNETFNSCSSDCDAPASAQASEVKSQEQSILPTLSVIAGAAAILGGGWFFMRRRRPS